MRLCVRPIVVAITALFISAHSAFAADDSVTLRFQWPEQVQGRAEYITSRTKSAQNRKSTVTVQGSHDFSVQPIDDGRLVTFANPKFVIVSDSPVYDTKAKLRDILLHAANTPPSYVIDENGAFVRLEGLAEFRAGLMDGLKSLIADIPEERQRRVRQVVETVISEPRLAAGIVENWNRDVGFWVDVELAHEKVYELDYVSSTPMFGDTQIPMRATYRYVGPASCIDGRSGSDCVELELHSFVNSDKLDEALEAYLQNMAQNSDNSFTVEELQVDTVIRLVTESDTLLPHRVTEKKKNVIVVKQGDVMQETRELEERRTVYNY